MAWKKAKRTIHDDRLDAMHEYYDRANGNQRREMLTFFMAIVNHKQIKEFCENFELDVK